MVFMNLWNIEQYSATVGDDFVAKKCLTGTCQNVFQGAVIIYRRINA